MEYSYSRIHLVNNLDKERMKYSYSIETDKLY